MIKEKEKERERERNKEKEREWARRGAGGSRKRSAADRKAEEAAEVQRWIRLTAATREGEN